MMTKERMKKEWGQVFYFSVLPKDEKSKEKAAKNAA